uniref:F-box domain-containing protein n=1 Tax=Aegilops tauschii TaxID=37682 RepID=M8C0J4_AEGTA
MDQTETLPDDTLANVLRRLPPCAPAAPRCVRRTWCDVVDAHRLLLPHLLPHSLHGIFINYVDYRRPHCFARPSAQKPAIDCNLDFLPGYAHDYKPIADHCNGLLLYRGRTDLLYVANPATRQWEDLCRKGGDYKWNPYLVFDPAVSPHYEVFSIPYVPEKVDLAQDSMEWPPSSWMLDVFSSSTRQWCKRSFLRQGEAMGTVANARLDTLRQVWSGARWRYSVYWRGSLYVHCRGAFVARLSLSDGKYQVIKLPNIAESERERYLGKSEKGVYLAIMADDTVHRLWVYNLVESSEQTDWMLKYHVDLEPWASAWLDNLKGFDKTWTLDGEGDVKKAQEEARCSLEYDDEDEGEDDDGEEEEMLMGGNPEWNSDNDNVLDLEDDRGGFSHYIDFLGFHPYNEVVFLGLSFKVVAYHLKTSKVQYLGNMRPSDYYLLQTNGIYESFPYTPCMIGELQKHTSRSSH